MKIVLFTIDHIEYAPRVIDPFLEKYGDMVETIYVSRSHFDWQFLRKRAGFSLRNLYPFCISTRDLLRFVAWKFDQAKRRKRHASVVEYYRANSYKANFVDSINAQSFLDELTALEADIYLFPLLDQIAGEKFLKTAKRGAYNLHMGKLPEYRGALSSFWVLRFGDDTAGVTLHHAVKKLDAGNIIAESRFKITTHSMKELMNVTMDHGAQTLIEGVERLMAGDRGRPPAADTPSGYFFIPKRRDFQEFYRRGCRLI